MKDITKRLINAYNEADSKDLAISLRQRLFHELMAEYGVPHFAVTYSQQEFLFDGVAKIDKVMGEKGKRIETYEHGGD